ncbi:cation-transporting P-type ATPase, partial [Salmonella enterica]|uniref:cation-transporting P-type ATPase n=1 Tax=Salmonella enterica TaxID=28901 RepID=UPI003D2752DD
MSLAAALPSLVGLSDREAEERLAVDGPNEPFVARPTSVLGGIVRRTANPLVFILLFAAAASAVL